MITSYSRCPEGINKVFGMYRLLLELPQLDDRERSCLELLVKESIVSVEAHGYLVPETLQWFRSYQRERGQRK